MPYLLVIDSGNTTIKWGVHDGHGWYKQGRIAQTQRESLSTVWQLLPAPSSIVVSNVAGPSAESALLDSLSIWGVAPRWVTATPRQCGVVNQYLEPAQLGCDRWAALIAAWNMKRQGCLVINVGTAMTVDALSDHGEFLGGIILPGFASMKQSLTQQTALLTSAEGCFQAFPNTTHNAIHSGIIHALTGAIERMHALLLARLGRDRLLECVISGGGAALLRPHIKIPTIMVDYLVLEGLRVIAEESIPIASS